MNGGTADNESSCRRHSTLAPSERLYIPHRKRLSHGYVVNDDGVRELRIDYGIKEISFDEARLFPFAEQLVRELSFTGDEATTWGPGYPWSELGPMLEALVAEGILQRGERTDDPRGGGLVPSPLPPSQCPVARFWSTTECESITADLARHPVEIGYLESFVAVFRSAHPALDADDRQVGEANVYPPKLRLDRETEWRVCQYPGSRYRDDAPMNITALRAMIKHWKPMMATLLRVRAELARRLDSALDRRAGRPLAPWTIGELHTLAAVVLALPAYQLQRAGGSSPQRPLHPVLSSLFRISDGIRMVTSAMLFSIEHTRRADEPLTGGQLYDHAEQNGVFIGKTGVCAGPRPMIDEFLAIAVDGVPAEGIAGIAPPAEVQTLLDQLPAAIDYALLGLQTWGVSLSVWLAMSRAYQALDRILAGAGERLAQLRARLRGGLQMFEHLQITRTYDQEVHLAFYRDAYERAWRGATTQVGPPTLAEAIAIRPEDASHRAAAEQLRGLMRAQLSQGQLGDAALAEFVAAVVHYLREEQAVLARTEEIQRAINTLLDRPHPRRPLGVRDIRVNFLMAQGASGFPYLFDALERELGIRVTSSSGAIDITGGSAG